MRSREGGERDFFCVFFPLFPSCCHVVPIKVPKGSRVPNIGSHQVLKHQIGANSGTTERHHFGLVMLTFEPP